MAELRVGYVNVQVVDFERAVAFFTQDLELELNFRDDEFGYASFAAGPISFAVVRAESDGEVGRHTGIGFLVDDIQATYERLAGKGVEFTMPPTAQPWGGTLALFKDPDGNQYYLDPGT